MAIIPQYRPQTEIKPEPGARVSAGADAAAFGAGAYQALGGVGQLLLKRGVEMQDEQDRNAIIQGRAALDEWASGYLFNPNEDEKGTPVGIMHRKGLQATDITNIFSADYKTKAEEISAAMKTQKQRESFMQYAQSQSPNYFNAVAKHQATQHQAASLQAAETGNANAKSLAVADPFNQDFFNLAVDTIRKNNQSVYGKFGQDTVDRKNMEDMSSIRIEQINSFLSQDNGGLIAEKLFEMHGNEILPEHRDNVQAAINKIAVPQRGMSAAEGLFKKYGLADERGAMEELKADYGGDPNFKNYASALKSEFTYQRHLERQEKIQRKNDLALRLFSTDSLPDAQKMVQQALLNGDISARDGASLLKEHEAKVKILSSDKATPEQKHWAKYATDGGLVRDLRLMSEKEEVRDEKGELTPQQKTKYHLAENRIFNYYNFDSRPGAYDLLDVGTGSEAEGQPPGAAEETPDAGAISGGNVRDIVNAAIASGEDYEQTYAKIAERVKEYYPDATDEEIDRFVTKELGAMRGD